jgi:diguanylate cyclase (GGDEF)-like protein/PAS domain S-box-containing protein
LFPIFESSRYGFSPFAAPTLATAMLMLVFGTSVLARRMSRVAGAFFAMTVAASVWLIAFTFMYCARDAATALFWARAAYLGVPFLAPAIYHFTAEMLRIAKERRGTIVAGWGLAILFSALAVSGVLVGRVQRYWWGYYPRYSLIIAPPFLAFFFGYLIVSLIEFLRAYPKSRGVEKRRIRLLLMAFGVAYLGCVDYLPKFGLSVYPFGYIPLLGFVIIVAIAFRKYDLVAITPSLAAREIIGTMADVLFVCDRDGRIEFANAAAARVLGYGAESLVGRQFEQLLATADDDPLAESFRRQSIRNMERRFVGADGRQVDLMMSLAPVIHHGEPAGVVILGRDMREHKDAERALRESELRYRLLFEQNAAGVCVMEPGGAIVDCNRTFATMLGYERAELVGRHAGELYVRPSDRDDLVSMLRDGSTLNSVEVELRKKDGQSIWALKNITLAGDGIHTTVVDITDRRRAEEQIEFHAYHDVLTQLPNRKLFTDRLTHSLSHARRSGKTVAVMFVDLDHFKSINDTLGHEAGDELLLEISRRLRASVRDHDTVARLGGDEFTIILSELRNPENAVSIAEKIILEVARPVSLAGTSVEITVSIGIALFPDDGADAESLLRNADRAMYRAKESGRNTYQLCTDELKRRAVERRSIETRLRRAIAGNELVLHYQPQISLISGMVVGVEALVRWNDPERGLVHPSSFIPLAEESRLILPLGEWVLRTACMQMRAWRNAGLQVPVMAVNLSLRQFQQNDIVEGVRRVLDETGLDAGALELEITETTAMQNAETTIELLHALRELGVSIAIDDFGTGYSSLNYLKRFPITAVKIDRAFIRDLTTSEGDAAIVSAVVGIARALKLRVVAEGVETEEQLSFLKRRNCDAAQGYLFSRPVSAAGLPSRLVSHSATERAVRLHV